VSAPAGYEIPPNQSIFPALGVDREKYFEFGITAAPSVGSAARREPGLIAGKGPANDSIGKQTMCH